MLAMCRPCLTPSIESSLIAGRGRRPHAPTVRMRGSGSPPKLPHYAWPRFTTGCCMRRAVVSDWARDTSHDGEPTDARLLGSRVSRIARHGVRARITRAVEGNGQVVIASVNMHHLTLRRSQPALRIVDRRVDLLLADGAPIVWALRVLAGEGFEKISGSDLLFDVFSWAEAGKWRIFLLGAGPGVGGAAAERLTKQFPSATVSGVLAPSREDLLDVGASTSICESINAVSSDVVIVALPQPIAERWATTYIDRLDASVAIGVGAALDFAAGRVRRAPRLLQKVGLEWAWRLCVEPRRLARRYLIEDMPTAIALAVEVVRESTVRRRQYEAES